jgi:hypothetical protein
MILNFNPNKLENVHDRFIWTTISYILNILELLKKKNDKILLDILSLNINSINKIIINDKILLIKEDFNCYVYEKYFIKYISNVKIDNSDLIFLN